MSGRLIARPLSRRSRQGSLYQQIKLARFWLPISIVGVVLVQQLFIVPLGNESWQFWEELLFYSILGPAVTFITLDWISAEVRRREQAQDDLKRLFDELQASHAVLGAIQRVTEQFASAPDLETALSAASEGIVGVTRATGAAILLQPEGVRITESHGLSPALLEDASRRNDALHQEKTSAESVQLGDTSYWVLTAPVVWGDKAVGSVHAYYQDAPGSDQRESFGILAAEFSAAAEAARSRTRDLLTLVEVDRSIRAEGNLERLLTTLLSHVIARADATSGGVYLADDDGRLHLSACRGASCVPGGPPLWQGEGFIGRAAAAAKPCIAARLSGQDLASSGPLLRGAQSAVVLPLTTEQALLGVVVLAHAEPDQFDEASLPFLDLVAGQVSLAVRNASAYLQSEELAIAEERARIAREIHDGVAQSLAFSALKLDLVTRLLETDRERAEAELSATKSTLREMIKEVRRSIFALRPVDLEHHGFVEAVRRYCRDYSQQNAVTVDLEVADLPQLSTKSEAALFRIFQEAMHNVAKHAGASTVVVKVGTLKEGQVFVSVEDDGQGFDLDTVSDRVTSAGGLGLKQMRERVENRGGSFEVVTTPGVGTRVVASVVE